MAKFIRKIIHELMSGSHDGKIVRDLQGWLVDSEHSEEKDMALAGEWEKLGGMESDNEELMKSWKRFSLDADNGSGDRKTRRPFLRKIAGYAAAAAAACLIAAAGWYSGKERYGSIRMAEVHTEAAELRTVVLPDGSIVKTNASTTLIYPEEFVGKTRNVFLVGEASFSVKADSEHPFIVNAGDVEVKAVGTEFNVSAYSGNENIVTTLVEGKVNILCDNENGDSFTLAPGQQMTYGRTSEKGIVTDVDVDDFTAWQRGVLVLKSCSMQEVLSALHQKYNRGCPKNPNIS